MALLLLDRAHLQVRTEGDALALYEAGTRRGTVPIKLIDRCVVHGAQTQLDSGMLLKLAEAGAAVIFMSPRQHRRVAMVLGPRHNDAAVRLAQARLVLDEAHCQQWSHQLVRAKLQRQCRSLQRWMNERPDARKPLWDALESIRSALQFSGRNRRPPRDPVNACLSLGYTLLHAQAVQACHAAGLDPLLGFYHRPAFGRESLASDLIEPLRSEVDQWVWGLVRQRELREHHFTLDKGCCLLDKTGRSIFYARWESQQAAWKRWLRLQVRTLARQLRQQGEAWLEHDTEDEAD